MAFLCRFSAIRKFQNVQNLRTTTLIKRNYVQFSLQKQTPCFSQSFIQMRFKSFNFFKKMNPEGFKEKDNIPQEFNLIYRNTMERYLLMAQILSAACAGSLILVLLMQSNIEKHQIDFYNWVDAPLHVESEFVVYITCLAGLCTVLQYMVAKMPLRVYNNNMNKYIFIFNGSLPTIKKQVACELQEITKIQPSGFLPWKESRFEVKDRRGVILLETFFRQPADLNIILGHHKPVDF